MSGSVEIIRSDEILPRGRFQVISSFSPTFFAQTVCCFLTSFVVGKKNFFPLEIYCVLGFLLLITLKKQTS